MSRLRPALLALLCVAGGVFAQNEVSHPRSAYTSTDQLRDVRPFASWFADSVISEGVDVEPFFDVFDRGDGSNGYRTGARLAVWSIEMLELGGQIMFLDIDEEDQGLADLLVYGRYEIDMGEDMPDVTVGGHVDLPTGKESIGENTVDFTAFAAARFGLVSGWEIHANAGLESKEFAGDRESGIIMGGGLIVPISRSMAALSEFNIGNNDFAEVTAGVDYELPPGNHLRAGLSVGLDTGAPDFVLRFSMAIPIY